jgi:hypothetical protein
LVGQFNYGCINKIILRMKNHILLFIFIVIIFANKSEPNNPKKNFAETVGDIVSVINPKVKAAIEILSLLKGESSTKIGDRQDQPGFSSIQNNYDYGHGSVVISTLNDLILFWLDDDVYNFLNKEQINIISKSLAEYTFQLPMDPFHKQKYELSFSNGQGSIFMMIINFAPHPTNKNAIKWEKFVLKTDFIPAPSYVIITESDCNILSCDRTDKIVYLPIIITKNHIEDIVRMNIEMLIGFNNILMLNS